MRNILLLLIILLAVPLAYAHGAKEVNEHSNSVNPIQPTAESQSAGKAIFEQNCATCHGADGNGVLQGMPALTDHGMMSEMSEGDIFHKISEGVPGTGMPPWEDVLTEEERWHLVNYVNTLHHGEEEGTTYVASPKKGICGPTALLLISTLPLLFASRRFFF
jgi:mono/diheme cytochrome c family protein